DRNAPEPRKEVLADAALVGQEGGATYVQPGRKPSGRQSAELCGRGGRVDPRPPAYVRPCRGAKCLRVCLADEGLTSEVAAIVVVAGLPLPAPSRSDA